MLPDGTKYPLVEIIEDKEAGDQKYVLRQSKAEIGDRENNERREQYGFASPSVGEEDLHLARLFNCCR